MKLELITAEGPATLWMRKGRLIRFPQLTMPLLAALTPERLPKVVSSLAAVLFQQAVREDGITVVLTSHDPTLLDIADDVLELRRAERAPHLGGRDHFHLSAPFRQM